MSIKMSRTRKVWRALGHLTTFDRVLPCTPLPKSSAVPRKSPPRRPTKIIICFEGTDNDQMLEARWRVPTGRL